MYALRAKRAVGKVAEALPGLCPSLEPAFGIMGTLRVSAQIAQSKIFVLGLAVLLPALDCDDDEMDCVEEEAVAWLNPLGMVEPDSSSPSSRIIGW